ncbi:MAG: hypothetical protein JSR82_15875 [Verrucomicrobia bacterium]|nr:hypothetical protein [Verrucomicrobiota bacterium]
MTENDLQWVQSLLPRGLVQSPVLEMGVNYEGQTCRQLCLGAGLQHYGTDLEKGRGADFAADFEKAPDMEQFRPLNLGSILALNVLEHTFDPVRILDHALSILRPGGTLVVATPAVWPLHDYPFDACRLLPNFYEQYARRRGLALDPDSFAYVGYGRVDALRQADGTYAFPRPTSSRWHDWYSRAVHKLFNTTGRHMFFPSHVCIGCVLTKPAQS